MIYLDNNATTPLDPLVLEAMAEAWKQGPLNPSSQHAAGRRARGMLETATAGIARLLGTDIVRTGGSRLLLTSGGTEANNWALRSLVPAEAPRWIGATEHPSVLAAAERHARQGHPVHWIPVDAQGVVRVDALEQLLAATLGEPPSPAAKTASHTPSSRPRGLVSVMAANNETGVLQPIGKIAALCRRWQVALHTDATQWIGKLAFDFDALGVSAATFAPHKFHGPVGIGGLLLAPGFELRPEMVGGQQQLGQRPGTEPVPLVVGTHRALELALDGVEDSARRVAGLRDLFESELARAIPGCTVHSAGAPRLPGTTSISFPGVDRQMLLVRLDLSGVACSTGSACSSGSSQASPVLQAMGVPAEHIEGALRFSLSRFSTAEEVLEAIPRISGCYHKLRSLGMVEK